MRYARWALAFLCCAGSAGRISAEDARQWEPVQVGAGETSFLAVAVDPADPNRMIAASQQILYESTDGGGRWDQRFHVSSGASVTDLAVGSQAGRPFILAATDQGLYGSLESTAGWSRLFHGAGEGERHATRVAFQPGPPGRILLGTRGGLFVSSDGGRHWTEIALPQAARDILDFAIDPQDPDQLHLVAAEGVFTGNLETGGWQQQVNLFGAEDAEVEESDLAAGEANEEPGVLHRLSAIEIDPKQPATLYAAGTRGLSQSLDGGHTWRVLPRTGLQASAISRLLVQAHSPVAVYAATGRGVARYEPAAERWTMLVRGLAARRIHDLAASPTQLWAATDQGLYRYEIGPDPFAADQQPSPRELLANFAHEPAISAVREAAIRYAEVHPDKIRTWRRQAALQALLPTFDVGFDRNRTQDAHVDEGTFPNFQVFQTEDRDANWDLGVRWDLGELIWNQDQTSIDVRSKLMAQLRDDIVDEVTRTYFERRRLQVALLTNPPADDQGLLDKELRLQELTALLDGLTGGYFSRHAHFTPNQQEVAHE